MILFLASCSLYIINFEDIPRLVKLLPWNVPSALDIINFHVVANEFGHFRRYVLNMLQFVHRF